MEFHVEKTPHPENLKADLVAFFCFEGEKSPQCPSAIRRIDAAMRGELSRQIQAEKFLGKDSTALLAFGAGTLPARNVMLIGLGKPCTVRYKGKRAGKDPNCFRNASAMIALAAQKKGLRNLTIHVESSKGMRGSAIAGAVAEGLILGEYRFDKYKGNEDEIPAKIGKATLICDDVKDMVEYVDRGVAVATAIYAARDLTNTPGCDATPGDLAMFAKKMAAKSGLSCTVLDVDGIRKERMGCLLAVARGSTQKPAFIRLEYRPKKKAKAHVAIVGKGVTFDSGGISLKTPRGMDEMKSDMAGAADVIATMMAIAELKPALRVTGLVPAAENMPSGGAIKPGDIIKARGGKTIEVVNTDAEGRLILADALSYAADMKPDAIIDVATLTGGAAYCCGELYSLVMGNDDHLVERLMKASKACGEYLWQLPIVEEYKKGYTSGIADLNNNGKGKAQTILGAIFLREFVGDIPWAHIDIGASAWTEENIPLSIKGATGAAVRTLIEFLMNYQDNG